MPQTRILLARVMLAYTWRQIQQAMVCSAFVCSASVCERAAVMIGKRCKKTRAREMSLSLILIAFSARIFITNDGISALCVWSGVRGAAHETRAHSDFLKRTNIRYRSLQPVRVATRWLRYTLWWYVHDVRCLWVVLHARVVSYGWWVVWWLWVM